MKNLLLLFILLLSVLGCAPELIAPDDPEEESENITDSIHDFKPGSKDSVWLEGGKKKGSLLGCLLLYTKTKHLLIP